MPDTTHRLDALGVALAALQRVQDPRERLVAIRNVRAELKHHDDRLLELLRDTILELRAADPPLTWEAIGDIMGVKPQRAQQIVAARFTTKKETP